MSEVNQQIVVAFGGVSPEHEVSVLTAMQAIAALEDTNYGVIPLYVTKSGRWLTGEYLLDLEHYKDLEQLEIEAVPCTFAHDSSGHPVLMETQKSSFFSKRRSYHVYAVLTAFHGSEGENGSFQGACEFFNIPYSGSGVLASSVGMDKVAAKAFCRDHDIPVVDDINFWENEWVEHQDKLIGQMEQLGYPLIVKPARLGSSIGVARASDRDSLIEKIETAFRYDAHLLVEKAVDPLTEINCSVLGDAEKARPSVCERPMGQEEILSFKDKYQSDEGAGPQGMASADRVIPADIDDELADKIQQTAVKAFKLFQASGVSRIDFLLDPNSNSYYFNEINTIPGSFSFYLWEESGLSFTELMLELIELAVKKHREKNGRIRSYDTNLLSEKAVKGLKGLKGSK